MPGEQKIFNSIYNCGHKEVHSFHEDISPKVNVTARLEFKLAYYDITVQHINNHTLGSPKGYCNHIKRFT